ncbi:MAG: PepSY-associated TM helix domain-containing protein [Acidobacteriota bacterium]
MTADQLRSVWKRRFAKYSRWLHIYISMASCAVVLFFAVTGLTLNHADWFSGAERTTQTTGQMNVAWTNTGSTDVSKLDIVEFLRQTHRISGAVTDLRSEDRDLSIAFKGPGYAADVLIDRATGKYELTESRLGLVAIVNDLHKGRDTGAVWKVLIDASAILLTLISLTGLLLLYFVYKHRAAGYLLMALGTAMTYVLYLAWVP